MQSWTPEIWQAAVIGLVAVSYTHLLSKKKERDDKKKPH